MLDFQLMTIVADFSDKHYVNWPIHCLKMPRDAFLIRRNLQHENFILIASLAQTRGRGGKEKNLFSVSLIVTIITPSYSNIRYKGYLLSDR